MSIIEVKNVKFSYSGSSPVLNDISMSIEKGEFVAVVGHNGSGKSTLARHFNGLLLPTSGKILVKGMDTTDEKYSLDIRRAVGMVFQNPDNQLVTSIVEDDIAFGPENLGVPPEEIQERVKNALETVGMTNYSKSAPHMLSGGQKQRVAIAGMLAMQPEVLVLDEATSMLDTYGRNDVLSTVKKLNRDGITVIMITQYMEEAALADRIFVLSHGRVEMCDTPERIFASSNKLRSLGLDVPPIVDIRNRLISAKALFPTREITVEAVADKIADEFRKRGKM